VTEEREVLEAVRSAMRSEPRIHAVDGPIHLAFSNGELTMEGEVDHISGKKLALEAAAGVPDVSRIIDRLHVRPPTPMGDGDIRDRVRNALLEEISLASCTIRVWVKGQPEIAREPPGATGSIEIRVEDGVVTLDGDVTGLGQKRMAGVLAWWVPGSRDVIDGIGVTPPEQDSEAAITDAVLQILEKDPFVDANSIQVHTRRAVVTLDGTVPREAERKLAEDDAWYVFGVDKVVNRLSVRT
jgi:osmotically-inducible protein OsmY